MKANGITGANIIHKGNVLFALLTFFIVARAASVAIAAGAAIATSMTHTFDLDTTPRIPPASGTILDFETEAEREIVPAIDNASCKVCVTNRFATSGENALAFVCADWRPGMQIWPSFTMNIRATDWTGYDRLVIDVVNIGDGCGTFLGLILGGPGGRIQGGKKAITRVPENGFMQWIVPLGKMPKSVPADAVTRIHFFTEFPSGFAVAIDRLTLLKPDETPPMPDGPHVGRDLWPRLAAKQREMEDRLADGDGYALDVARFRSDCRANGVASHAMLLGKATSMEKIMPRGRFSATPLTKDGLSVRVAGNEYESVQLLVMPKGDDLKGVKVAVEGDMDLAEGLGLVPAADATARAPHFSSTNIHCSVMGYVSVTNQPPYWVGYNVPSGDAPGYLRKLRPPELGWWPDPILDFMDSADVSGTDLQSFWVRVYCPEGQPAGVYRGALVISAEDVEPVSVPLVIRVNGFSLGRTSELPLAITFDPKASGGLEGKRVEASPNAPVKLWKRHNAEWVDFLADYLISFDSLYDWGDPRRLFAQRRLQAQGRSGLMNLGYWSSGNAPGETEKFRKGTVARLKNSYERAKAAGQDKFYIYGCDEATEDRFHEIRAGALEIKKALPGIPLSTTAYDHKFGVGTQLDVFDWFTPLTPIYDMERAAASRSVGHQVWWYICCQPAPPYANMFIECPAIEGRLLMGAMTQRMKPDGFLYYQISIWNATECISSGPFTDWPARSYQNYHGDGYLTYVGPDGIPIPSLRLENFRDGLEDYAYAKILEEKLREMKNGKWRMENDGGVQPSNGQTAKPSNRASWAQRAREALAVPRSVMDTMTNYTDDSSALYRWRDEMADLIEEAVQLTPPTTSTPQRKDN